MAESVLMIEDDRRLADMVTEYLAQHGSMSVTWRGDATTGLRAAKEGAYDAVILDVMLPDLDGFEVCKKIRGFSTVPVIMLTARGEETDRVVGLELGADDYLPKPFSPRELLARLRAIIRRSKGAGLDGPTEVMVFGNIEIDCGARTVRVGGKTADLTAHQFDLLKILAENAGRVLSRDTIMDRLRGDAFTAFDRSIDVHISRIRSEIESDPKHPERILTIRGSGYMFAKTLDDGGSGD